MNKTIIDLTKRVSSDKMVTTHELHVYCTDGDGSKYIIKEASFGLDQDRNNALKIINDGYIWKKDGFRFKAIPPRLIDEVRRVTIEQAVQI